MSSEDGPGAVWRAGSPIAPAVIAALEAAVPDLPDAYLAHIREHDGSEGNLAVEPGWIAFWPAADVVNRNSNYCVGEHLPGFLGFGSNGGGELLAFDTRARPWRICMIPFLPMDESEAVQIAVNFEELSRHFGRNIRAG